jgi:transcriptional regulator with XRE-family HTH domain
MNGDAIKGLRKELGCTARDLATALGTDQTTILAWERGELFATKAAVDRMAALRAAGPKALVRSKSARKEGPMASLRDPDLWAVVRKLIAHPRLRDAVAKLAAEYDDPTD